MPTLQAEIAEMERHQKALEAQTLAFAKAVQARQRTIKTDPHTKTSITQEVIFAKQCWANESIKNERAVCFTSSYEIYDETTRRFITTELPIHAFAGCTEMIAQLFSEDDALEHEAITQIGALSNEEKRFLLLQLNALAPAGWAKSLGREVFHPELLAVSDSFVLRGSAIRKIWDILVGENARATMDGAPLPFTKTEFVISQFLVQASRVGGLSYAQKAAWYGDDRSSDGYLQTGIAQVLIEEGSAPYLSQDQNYSQSFNRQKPDPYKVPLALLDAEKDLVELELVLRPESLLKDDFNTLNARANPSLDIKSVFPEVDFSSTAMKAWGLIFLSQKLVKEYHNFGDRPIAKSDEQDFVKHLQIMIARLTTFEIKHFGTIVSLEPALEALREINNRITACGVYKQSQKALHSGIGRKALPKTEPAAVQKAVEQISQRDRPKGAEVAILEKMAEQVSVLIMTNRYGLYTALEDPRTMSAEALDAALMHYDGFIFWNELVFQVEHSTGTVTRLEPSHPCYNPPEDSDPLNLIRRPERGTFRLTTEDEYRKITKIKKVDTPTIHVPRAVELGVEADRLYALICHEGMNRSQVSYDVVNALASIDSYWTLMVQGAESGFFPYQVFAGIDEDTIYGYLQSKMLGIEDPGEWLHRVFHHSLGSMKSIREGGQTFREADMNIVNIEGTQAGSSMVKKVELTRQLARALHEESMCYMVRNAIEGRKESLVLFMRASHIIGASLNTAIDKVLAKIQEEAQKCLDASEINAYMEIKKQALKENLRVVCCFTADNISRAGGQDEQKAFQNDYTQSVEKSSIYFPELEADGGEYGRDFISSLRHQYCHSEEFASLFTMNEAFVAKVDASYEASKHESSILNEQRDDMRQDVVRHTEASLRKTIHYWEDVEGRLQKLGPNALRRAFRNQVVNQHFAAKIQLLAQLLDVVPEAKKADLQALIGRARILQLRFNALAAEKSGDNIPCSEESFLLKRDLSLAALKEQISSFTIPYVVKTLKTWAITSTTKNSTLIRKIHTLLENGKDMERDVLPAILQIAKERKNRSLSKGSFFGAGRDTKIVQPLYDILAEKESLTLDEFTVIIEQITIQGRSVSSENIEDLRHRLLLPRFQTFFENHEAFSRHTGIKNMCAVIKKHGTDRLTMLHEIAKERQNKTWSKLSIFHQGRDTQFVQPLYDLMADPNFGANKDSMDRLQNILEKLEAAYPLSQQGLNS